MSRCFRPKVVTPLAILFISAPSLLAPGFVTPVFAAAAPAPVPAPAAPAPAVPAPAVPTPPPSAPAVPTPPITEPAPDNSAFALPPPAPPLHGTVVDIQYTGLNHLKDSAPTLFASRLQTRIGAPYSEAAMDQDAQMIFNTGYFYNVRPRAVQGPTGITVIFDLVEETYITAIHITGNKVVPTSVLLGLMATKPNQVLNNETILQDLNKIRAYYRDKGYIYAIIIDATPDPNTGILPIVIGEGIVQQINIQGNKKTKSFVVLRVIKTKPGSVFNQTTWQNDLKAIARLNIFSDLHFTVASGSEPGKIILNLVVTEQRTGTVNFGFGYNTRERGVIFLDLADTNFRGRAESVDAQLELGGYQIRGSYRFAFFEPYLAGSQFSAGANIFKTQVDRIVPGSSGDGVNGRYFETDTGEGITLGRRLSETRQVLLDLTSENINSDEIYGNVVSITGGSVVSSSSNVSPFLLQNGYRATAALRGVIDTRDNALNPRYGAFSELILQPGRGTFSNPGDTESHPFTFLQASMDLRKYIPVGAASHKEDTTIQKVLAMRLLYGRTSPGIPAFQYFFLGGADTLRGYQEDNFFGENEFLYSAELRIPVALNKLQLVTFVDTGDAWGGSYTPDRTFRLNTGVGAGVRVTIPSIGPLRLDYGIGRFGGRTHFSIGQTF